MACDSVCLSKVTLKSICKSESRYFEAAHIEFSVQITKDTIICYCPISNKQINNNEKLTFADLVIFFISLFPSLPSELSAKEKNCLIS